MMRISVIVPAFNAARTLAQTLASARAQTCPPIEIIVVNDGSTDSTERIGLEAAMLGPDAAAPVRLISQLNQGVAAAMSQGVRASRGDWLTILDADDLWSPDGLSSHVDYLTENPHLDACLGWMDEFTCPSLAPEVAGRFTPREAQAGWLAGATLVKRDAFDRVGLFDPALRLGGWIDWVDRARRAGLSFGVHEHLVLHRRLHPGSLSLSEAARKGALLQVARLALMRKRQNP
jgi:glycosyltransferase involved in cell wall biosynthesis